MTIIKGTVDSINPEQCTCNVKIPDQDDRIINDLQIVFLGTYGTQDYRLPAIGMMVVCIFDSNNDTDGFVLGGVYNEEQKPAFSNKDISATTYPDGSVVSYDSKNKKLIMNLVGDAEISGNTLALIGNVTINGKPWLTHIHDADKGTLKTSDGKIVSGKTGEGEA